MKALTICQPYAQLIIDRRKTCENRTWETKYRGPIYIHAGKNKSWLDLENGIDEGSGLSVDSMVFGAVVGIAELVGCIHIDSPLILEWREQMTDEQRDHVTGPWCWMLKRVHPIGPWPYRGAQGLFEINDEELGRIANEVLAR